MTSGFDWAIVLDAGVGLGVFLIGVGILTVCSALARTLARLNGTLDEVDRQVAALSAPVIHTLGHVDGIANTADATLARLGGAVGQLETVANGAGRASNLLVDALTPGIINLGTTLTGVTAGVRRLIVRTNGSSAVEQEEPAP